MLLYLLRHAKTDQLSITGKDFDRKLLKKGVNQAAVLGKYFEEHQINPAHIYCSTAARTRQTISGIQKNHSFDQKVIFKDELYLCGKDVLLNFLWSEHHGEDVLIIGHNNGISDFAEYLIDDFVELKTGELIVIEFDAELWNETSQGTGTIVRRFRPVIVD